MRTEAAVQADLVDMRARAAVLQHELKVAQGRRRVCCKKCKKFRALSKWIFVIWNHYIAPYSCNSGDYWTRSKNGEELCCPECGHGEHAYYLIGTENVPIAERVAGHLLEGYGECRRTREYIVWR